MAQDFPSHLIKHFFSIGNETKTNDHFFGQFSPELSPEKGQSSEHQEEQNAINQEVLSHLKTIVPELKFKTYFENSLELLEIDSTGATFSVRTAFIKKSADLYKEEIAKALYNVLGTAYEIVITSKDQNSRHRSCFSPFRCSN